jgi:putative endonuclease
VGIAAGALGALGERVAERWLVRRGWRVLDRRYRVGHRDIDLIVRRDRVVAFVEVKTRHSAGFGGPVCAVGRGKRRHLWRAATIWIDRHGEPGLEYRFDVIGVLTAGELIRIAHVENAFAIEHAR